MVALQGGRRARLVTRTHAPGFAVKRERGMTLASGESRPVALPSESALARRFRGFIDPQPIAQNTFEALRKPHLVALNMDPAAAIRSDAPGVASAVPAPPADAAPSAADTGVAAAPAAKQDRIAPVAASAPPPTVTKQVSLTDAFGVGPVAQVKAAAAPAGQMQAPVAPQAVAQAEVIAAPSAKPAEEPSRFPVHKLVLALCGALGAASALRFIVRA